MKQASLPSPDSAYEEVRALIATLQHAEQRLEELTGGEVDTIAGATGRPILLRKAQEELRLGDASKQAAILNALPANIALLDTDGFIVSVNETWRQFAVANSPSESRCGVGVNYLEICDGAEGIAAVEAAAAAAGIRSVLGGARIFSIEYSCHSPTISRWFQMTATHLSDSGKRGVVVMHLDVTARREAEEALRASQHRLRSLIDGLGPSMFVGLLSPQGLVIDVNQSALAAAGLQAEDVLGKAFDDTGWWSGLPTARRLVSEAIRRAAQGEASRFDVQAHGVGTQFIDVDFSMHPLRDESGAVAFLVPSAVVITERKEVEAALSASEMEFRTLAESMPQIVWTTSPDGLNTYFNQQWTDYTGLSLQASLGDGWIKPFHPDDRQHALDAWQLATRTSGTYSIESRLRGKDGAYSWWLVRGVPQLDAANQIVKWFGTCTQINELKLAEIELSRTNEALRRQQDELRVLVAQQGLATLALRASEQRFKALFDQAAVGVAQADVVTGRFVNVNQRYCDIVGRDRASLELLTFSDVVHPRDVARGLELTRELASGAIREFTQEKTYPRADGSEVWGHVTVSAMWAPGETPDYFIAILQDITERKKMEEQLRHAQKMEAMGTLAGGIAHDFNNILGAIIGYTEMARAKVQDNPVAREYLGSVLSGAQRAAALVRHILAFSRQEELSLRPARIASLVAEPLELMRAIIPATITFDVSLAEDLPAVLADATQVHQVVMNLCTNACHAMQGRPGQLVVRLDRVVVDELLARADVDLHPGLYVRLVVSDTGHGMDDATRARIFEPFFTTKAPGQGTGLGLAAVHGIMKSDGGAIAVSSQPGTGTTFSLYFPALIADAATVAVQVPVVPRGSGERVLFVDDDKALASLGKAMLEDLGYVVTVSSDPTEAFEAVRADPMRFALVISDLTMPVMTGQDLAASLRLIRPDLSMILTTGFAGRMADEGPDAAGNRDLLLKPYSLATLGTAVHEALKKGWVS